MKKDTIVIGDKEYRVEVNWNAIVAFLEAVGRDSLEELANFRSIRPTEIAALMAACINEGEQLEGRECKLTAKELGTIISPADVVVFMNIYVKQSAPKMKTEDPKKEEREKHPAP